MNGFNTFKWNYRVTEVKQDYSVFTNMLSIKKILNIKVAAT